MSHLSPKKVQHSTARNAILFEIISLIIHYNSESDLLVQACNEVDHFLQHQETSLHYLALGSMCTLASSEFSHELVRTHTNTVINGLKMEWDVSMLQWAADLLYPCATGTMLSRSCWRCCGTWRQLTMPSVK